MRSGTTSLSIYKIVLLRIAWSDIFLDNVECLENFAEIGAPLSSIVDTESDYRFLVTGNYLTFYRAYDGNVYIDRVLYGRSNYLRILFGDPKTTE